MNRGTLSEVSAQPMVARNRDEDAVTRHPLFRDQAYSITSKYSIQKCGSHKALAYGDCSKTCPLSGGEFEALLFQ